MVLSVISDNSDVRGVLIIIKKNVYTILLLTNYSKIPSYTPKLRTSSNPV